MSGPRTASVTAGFGSLEISERLEAPPCLVIHRRRIGSLLVSAQGVRSLPGLELRAQREDSFRTVRRDVLRFAGVPRQIE